MKKIFILIAMFLCGTAVFAQDAEYNLIRRQYTLYSDGTLDINYRKEIKLLRNRAITAYADKGETFILYNPAIDRLTINESYTIRKDGSKVQTPANAFVDQLPSSCENCGRYNGLRERVVVHTALEYDCIIVLDYTIHRRCAYLDETVQLTQDCPVKRYEISIQGAPLTTEEFSYGKKVNKSEATGSYKIVATNLPQSYSDSYLPPSRTLYPTLHFTLGNKPVATNLNEGSLPESANLIGELYDNDSLKHATAIRNYVIDYIKLNEIDASLLGYNISSARETFLSGCGTAADKAVLLAALLREAGMRATTDGNSVRMTLNENGIDFTYRLSAVHKNRLIPEGVALDEQRIIEKEETLPWSGVSVGSGYKQMTLPDAEGAINIDPARLTSVRTAPLQVRNCQERYHYTILLPRTPKHHLVGKPVQLNRTVKGVGSIRISIQETEHGSIDVVRELNIDIPNGIINNKKQYKAFRKMMQEWNYYKSFTIKTEPGKPRD